MRYSDSYVKTFHTESALDMLEIETIRKAIKVVNADLRRFKYGSRQKKDGYGSQSYEQYRVALKARGPRTIHARADGKHPRAYDLTLPLRHAERIDLYIYQR